MKTIHIEKFETYDAPAAGTVAFATPKGGSQLIHAGIEVIRLREVTGIPLVMLVFNNKLFCVTETTTIMDLIDEHDRLFDGSTETKLCLESMMSSS